MTYFTWLKEHGIWTAIYLFLLCTIELFLITMAGGGYLMGYVFVALTGGFFLWDLHGISAREGVF